MTSSNFEKMTKRSNRDFDEFSNSRSRKLNKQRRDNSHKRNWN